MPKLIGSLIIWFILVFVFLHLKGIYFSDWWNTNVYREHWQLVWLFLTAITIGIVISASKTPPPATTAGNLSRAKDMTAIAKSLVWTVILLAGAWWLITATLWKMNQPWSSTYSQKLKAEEQARLSAEAGLPPFVTLQPGSPDDPNGWIRIDRKFGQTLSVDTLDPNMKIWVKCDDKPPFIYRKGNLIRVDNVKTFQFKSAETFPVSVKIELK